jgi:rod shape-determining protein MreD
MRRAAVLFLTLALLWTVVAQANGALAPAHVYLFVGGLYVTFAALVLPGGPGLAAVFLAGLMCDANAPVRFGTHALLFAAAHAVLVRLRDRLPHEHTAGRVVVALLANLGLFVALSLLRIGRLPDPAAAWARLGADLVASQLFLALVAPWLFALQTRALALSGGAESRWRLSP